MDIRENSKNSDPFLIGGIKHDEKNEIVPTMCFLVNANGFGSDLDGLPITE
jgi:hypothetical protein